MVGIVEDDVKLAIDAAAGEWWEDSVYKQKKSGKIYTSADLVSYWEELCDKYPNFLISSGDHLV